MNINLKNAVVIFIILFVLPLPNLAVAAQNPYQEGMDYMRKGNYEMAVKSLEHALKTNPKNISLLYQIGLAHYNIGKISNIDKAISFWKKGADMLSGNDMMKITLLDIIKRAEDRMALLKKKGALEKLIKSNPIPLEAGLELVEIYKKTRLYSDAKALYEKLINVHPADYRAYAGLAESLYREGRILWAEHYYRLALDRSSENSGIKSKIEEIQEELEALGKRGYDDLVKSSHHQ